MMALEGAAAETPAAAKMSGLHHSARALGILQFNLRMDDWSR
jgi:hypothetical protein